MILKSNDILELLYIHVYTYEKLEVTYRPITISPFVKQLISFSCHFHEGSGLVTIGTSLERM